jgi:[protein-PII] uridylyltransferase
MLRQAHPLALESSEKLGLDAAHARAAMVDDLVREQVGSTQLEHRIAAVALGAYGRQEVTPRSDIELLLVHDGSLDRRQLTESVLRPLWERELRLEPLVKTIAECATDAQRLLSGTMEILDARAIGGDRELCTRLVQHIVEPLRRDRMGLRRRLVAQVRRRHAAFPSAVDSGVPDLVDGRGGLRDLQVLRWLDPAEDDRLVAALDVLLRLITAAEELVGHAVHRLSPRLQERVATALGYGNGAHAADAILADVYQHSRWVAFRLDGVLAEPRADRTFGLSVRLKRGQLHGERLPSLERVPSLGLSVANLVGFAPPDLQLLDWATRPGPPMAWDAAALDQLWLLLRAADWRSWEFLDVSGLFERYVPEWQAIARRRGQTSDGLALDRHSVLALRRLHEWVESGDAFATRLMRALRRRDWLYLAVLLHELPPAEAAAIARRIGLTEEGVDAIGALVEQRVLLSETAMRRDLHDEDMLMDLAARIGTPRRLRALILLTAAHDLASGAGVSTGWKAAQLRQLFTLLDGALRQVSEVGPRRRRSIEHHRARVARHLEQRGLVELLPLVPRLPRRYLLSRSPAFIARHLALAAGAPLGNGEVRLQARRQRGSSVWDVLIVARDRPGLLSTMAGVLALRGASVLAADAATCSDGLVLDVFTVTSAYDAPLTAELWPRVAKDVQLAVEGTLPLNDLLTSAAEAPADEVSVSIDNAISEFFSVVEVRAPDRVGLLYRITRALHEVGLDIHHAKVATYPEGALDVFYAWDLSGNKLNPQRSQATAQQLAALLNSAGRASDRVG